jgi:hypothetical protein
MTRKQERAMNFAVCAVALVVVTLVMWWGLACRGRS